MLYQIRLAIGAFTDRRFKATKKLLQEKHGVNALTIAQIDMIADPEPGLKYIVAAARELDFPFPKLDGNVVPCGPIMKPFVNLSDSDAELSSWLKKGPTIFINLGSHRAVDEDLAVEMAQALRFVFASSEDIAKLKGRPEIARLQVLWKLKQTGTSWFKHYKEYSTTQPGTRIHNILGKEIDEDRVRILPWIVAEPISVLDSGDITCFIHHAGANSVLEGC